MTRSKLALVCAIAAAIALLIMLPRHDSFAQDTKRLDGLQSFTMRFGGTDRTFGLYVPRSSNDGRPRALIVAFHGRFSSAAALHSLSHLSKVAEARGAVLLYPENIGSFWGDGGSPQSAWRADPLSDRGG